MKKKIDYFYLSCSMIVFGFTFVMFNLVSNIYMSWYIRHDVITDFVGNTLFGIMACFSFFILIIAIYLLKSSFSEIEK